MRNMAVADMRAQTNARVVLYIRDGEKTKAKPPASGERCAVARIQNPGPIRFAGGADVQEANERPPTPGPIPPFEILYAQFNPLIWRIARKTAWGLQAEHCGHAQTLAEDIHQEIWMHVWRTLPQYREIADLSHWIAKVAKLKAIDIYRRYRCEPWMVFLDDPAWEFLRNVLGRNASVYTGLSAAVRDCLRRLPKPQREAFVMHHLDELDYTDIATRLGRPVGTIRVWVLRARQSLIKCLAAKGITGAYGGGR